MVINLLIRNDQPFRFEGDIKHRLKMSLVIASHNEAIHRRKALNMKTWFCTGCSSTGKSWPRSHRPSRLSQLSGPRQQSVLGLAEPSQTGGRGTSGLNSPALGPASAVHCFSFSSPVFFSFPCPQISGVIYLQLSVIQLPNSFLSRFFWFF